MNLPELLDELKKHLGLPEGHPDFDNTRLISFINRSYHEIRDKAPFKDNKTYQDRELVPGTNEYLALDNDPVPSDLKQLLHVSILDPKDVGTDNHTPLDRINIREFESLYQGNSPIIEDGIAAESYRGRPTKYLIHGDYIQLVPAPDKAYILRVYHEVIDLDYADPANTLSWTPPVWHEIILFGAVYRGYVALGDMVRAQEFRNMQANLMNSTEPADAKDEQANVHNARLVPVRPAYRV